VSACVFCGGPSEYRHHPTGRDRSGGYLDPDYTVPVCHDDHCLVHDDFQTLEVA